MKLLILGIFLQSGTLIASIVPIASVLAVIAIAVAASFFLRIVVPTNMVHIVQSVKKTTSYGTGQPGGNVYYRWPSWIPFIGVTYIPLRMSNFNKSLHNYEAYDKDKVPFVLDLTAFFRISDTNVAAQRISNEKELDEQLTSILQGAVRKILASHDINTIMTDRATFGQQFTDEVKEELKNWGLEPVKNIELMDIRDAKGSTVLADIMAKKSSHINMESRIEVANNNKAAEVAEIDASQHIEIQRQTSEEAIGKRTADKEKEVGVSKQKAEQQIKTEEAITADKEKAVEKVRIVRDAEIAKEAAVVIAKQEAEVIETVAAGKLAATKLEAEGIEATGNAEGAAEKARQLAPVQAQIELAKEIGKNQEYQNYLVLLEFAKVYSVVGTEQAKALQSADVKIIANGGSAPEGVKNALDLFSANGGLAIGSMLEAIGNTPQGQELLGKLKGLLNKDLAVKAEVETNDKQVAPESPKPEE